MANFINPGKRKKCNAKQVKTVKQKERQEKKIERATRQEAFSLNDRRKRKKSII